MPKHIEPEFWVEWNLKKDGSWIAQGFHSEEERDDEIKLLVDFGYNPRKKGK